MNNVDPTGKVTYGYEERQREEERRRNVDGTIFWGINARRITHDILVFRSWYNGDVVNISQFGTPMYHGLFVIHERTLTMEIDGKSHVVSGLASSATNLAANIYSQALESYRNNLMGTLFQPYSSPMFADGGGNGDPFYFAGKTTPNQLGYHSDRDIFMEGYKHVETFVSSLAKGSLAATGIVFGGSSLAATYEGIGWMATALDVGGFITGIVDDAAYQSNFHNSYENGSLLTGSYLTKSERWSITVGWASLIYSYITLFPR